MELIRLGTYNSTTEANLIKARLEGDNIEAIVRSDDIGSMTPGLGDIRGVAVLVKESDRAEAMEILERMLTSGD